MRSKAGHAWLVGVAFILLVALSCAPADPGNPRTLIVGARVIDGQPFSKNHLRIPIEAVHVELRTRTRK